MTDYSEGILFNAERVYRRTIQIKQLFMENYELSKMTLLKLEEYPYEDNKLQEAIEYLKLTIKEIEEFIR